jgi:Peptidase family M28
VFSLTHSLTHSHALHIRAPTLALFTYAHTHSYTTDASAPPSPDVPFQLRGVPILHLIPVPFPPQWHKVTDDLEHIDRATAVDLLHMIGVFVARFLTV